MDCPEEKTYFFEDDRYRYYFDCPKDYYVKIGDVEYTLKNALENDLISINELEILYKREPINN